MAEIVFPERPLTVESVVIVPFRVENIKTAFSDAP